jgi:hypothetical protein
MILFTLKRLPRPILTASVLAIASAMPAMASEQTSAGCDPEVTGCGSATRGAEIGKNTERLTSANEAGAPVSISVDGVTVFGNNTLGDEQRRTDVALEKVDIQVKFDGLGANPILNVSTWPVRRSFQPGEKIRFLASSNYPAWIARSEVRVFEKGDDPAGRPLYRIAVSPEGDADWVMPETGPGDLVYVLRVVDEKGRHDETLPLSIVRSDVKLPAHETDSRTQAVAPGYGEDRTAFRNIPVYGGAITVYGRNIPARHNVHVLGDSVPVDSEQAFVVQRILPPGDHHVDVAVVDSQSEDSSGLTFDRTVNIPSNEWFYVGLADITLGRRFGTDNIEDVKPGEYDKIYSKGRLAFYLKGKIRGRYLLTAAADTGEGKLQDIIKGLDKKDPRQFLSRIDPEEFYPIYGDDSVAIEDAPTRGKFYVRLERGSSHVMWGNFKANITGTSFLRNERALYGAGAVYRSERTTRDGERRTELRVYAAQPGTLPQQDVFRGTGGSAYFLSHQDITAGSETVNVEVRDPTTGRVLSRRTLRLGFDYEIDYVQGLVLLKSPLSSSTAATDVVRDDALGGARQYLVVNYEYTPAAGDVDGYAFGGRAQQWIGNSVRLGVTGQREKTGPANQTMYGADILVRKSAGTYVEAEVAQSKGPGFGNSTSADGGYTISNTGTSGDLNRTANAYRVRGRVNFADLNSRFDGEAGAYYEKKQGGFSSLDEQVANSKRIWGADTFIQVTQNAKAKVKFDSLSSGDGKREDEGNAELEVAIGKHLTFTPGAKINDRRNGGTDTKDEGRRIDAGGEIRYRWDTNKSAYVFGQATVDRNGTRKRNDRIGVGGEAPITDKIGVYGEISTGSLGLGGKAGIDYHPTADDRYYLGYKLDPDRANAFDESSPLIGNDLGAIVLGANHRYSERLSVFAEETYDAFGRKRTLTQTYGVEYTPTAAWNVTAGIEYGTVADDTINSTSGVKNSDFDRLALSAGAVYHGENGFDGKLKGEIRRERSDDGTRDRNTYLVGAGIGKQTGENWRFLANLDAVLSDATDDTLNGKYVEGSAGYAYRPVETDALNALMKYTFLYDLPGPDQVTVNGTTLGPAQRSHIFSADVSYDLNRIVTLGAKYGLRYGHTKPRDGSAGWEQSSAHLGIVRADLHIVNKWDALLEARVLWNEDGANYGALAAIYREMGENFRVGVGYNFGQFSDDLRDLTFDDHGVFINAIGKF